ncbi:sialin-like [Mercenaria mercenaria]|uniref:sialin-like n=1 Tax=Mercenaria mercenaria TaxID=6596 RepID=UPI00234EC84A|nr:sialin-like [Mercenaria mercenaria]
MRVTMSVAIVCMTGPENNTSNAGGNDSESDLPELFTIRVQVKLSDQDDRFDWDKETQGLILGSFYLGYALTLLPSGWFAGRYGGKQLYGWSMFVCAVATLLTPLAARTSVVVLIVIRVFTGLCQGVGCPCMQTLLSYWIPPLQRSSSASFVYTGTQIGVMLAFSLNGVLCVDGFDGGWPSIFYVFGKTDMFLHRLLQKSSSTPWSKILTSLPVWAIIVSETCAEWGTYSFLTNIPTYMEDVLKFDSKKAGYLASLPYLGFWVVWNVSAHLADFLRKRGYISTTTARKVFNSIGNILPAIGITIMGNVADNPGIAVAMLILGVAMSGCQYGSGFIVNPVDIAPRYAGIIIGIASTTGSLAGFFAPLAIGFITVDKTKEQWKTVFYITAAIYTFGAIFYIIFASGELQDWARDEDDDQEIRVVDKSATLEVKTDDEKVTHM